MLNQAGICGEIYEDTFYLYNLEKFILLIFYFYIFMTVPIIELAHNFASFITYVCLDIKDI